MSRMCVIQEAIDVVVKKLPKQYQSETKKDVKKIVNYALADFRDSVSHKVYNLRQDPRGIIKDVGKDWGINDNWAYKQIPQKKKEEIKKLNRKKNSFAGFVL